MCSETTEHQPSYSFAAANSVVALTRMLNECEVKLGRLAAGQFSSVQFIAENKHYAYSIPLDAQPVQDQRKTACGWRRCPRRLTAPAIGTTTLWDPWNASRPTLEIMRTKCIWSLLLLAVIFLARHRGKLTVLPRPFIAEFKRGEGHTSIRKGIGETGVEQDGR